MSSFWEQLQTRQLPSVVVPLPIDGGTVDVELRALPADEFDALCALHPAGGPDAAAGQVDVGAIRAPLLAASVVADEGTPPRDPQWWADLAKGGRLTSAELGLLFTTAWQLNDRTPAADAGKG